MNKWTIQSILGASIALALAADASATGCAIGVGGGSSSENYGVEIDVVGAGGGDSSSPNFSIRGTLGQVVQNVGSSSPSYSDGSGMWDVLIAAEGEDPVYDPVGCQGEVLIASLADYQAYVANDYGRNGGDFYKHVRVISNLSGSTIALQAPCRIHVDQGLTLQGDIVLVDAREEVRFDDYTSIDANEACIESAEQQISFGRTASISSNEFTAQSRLGTYIDRAFDVDVSGTLQIGSSQGPLQIGRDLTIHAGEVQLQAKHSLTVDRDAYVESQEAVSLVSSSNAQSTSLGKNATLIAETIRLSSPGRTEVGHDAVLEATSSITIESTGAGQQSRATVQKGATVSAGADLAIVAGRRIFVGAKTTVLSSSNLEVDGGGSKRKNCLVNATASFSYGSVSGSCAAFVP